MALNYVRVIVFGCIWKRQIMITGNHDTPTKKTCKCLSHIFSKSALLLTQWARRLLLHSLPHWHFSNSSLSRKSIIHPWATTATTRVELPADNVDWSVCLAVDTKLAERCCKTTDNIRLPSSGINSEAGATVEQSTCGCVLGWGAVGVGVRHHAEQTHKFDHTSEMTDDNKPFLQTYLKVSQTAATMFGPRQFNRKRGALRRTQTLPGSSYTSLTSGRCGKETGGTRKLGEEGGFLCKNG